LRSAPLDVAIDDRNGGSPFVDQSPRDRLSDTAPPNLIP